VDGVEFCHATPRSDEEIITRATPHAVLLDSLADAGARLVIGGHTHQQVLRKVDGRLVYANAGSVGMPYEGRPGAFWMVAADGVLEPRETAYDIAAAAAELRASGYPDVEDYVTRSLLEPLDADWVTAFFEYTAGRGENPGEPRTAD
jgi:hypothetical protein